MCKSGISVFHKNDTGRIENVRISKSGILLATFTPAGWTTSSSVAIKNVEPMNKKSAKKLAIELEKLSSKLSKAAPAGDKPRLV